MKKKEEEKQKNVKKGRRIEKSEKVKKDSKEWKEQETEDKKHDTGKMETEVEKDLNETAPSGAGTKGSSCIERKRTHHDDGRILYRWNDCGGGHFGSRQFFCFPSGICDVL